MSENLEDLRIQLRRVAEQQSSDFEFLALGLQETGRHFKTSLETLGREMEERFHQLHGRVKLSEQRLSAMLQAVDGALSSTHRQTSILEDHERRIQALEQKSA